MRWLVKDLHKVHPITRKHLIDATPPGKDYMREGAMRSGRSKPGRYIAIALFSGNHLLGWAMLDKFLSGCSPLLRTYVFVKPEHRRKGYGTLLMKKAREAARRRGKGIRVCPYNRSSRRFFKSAGVTKSEVSPGFYL